MKDYKLEKQRRKQVKKMRRKRGFYAVCVLLVCLYYFLYEPNLTKAQQRHLVTELQQCYAIQAVEFMKIHWIKGAGVHEISLIINHQYHTTLIIGQLNLMTFSYDNIWYTEGDNIYALRKTCQREDKNIKDITIKYLGERSYE